MKPTFRTHFSSARKNIIYTFSTFLQEAWAWKGQFAFRSERENSDENQRQVAWGLTSQCLQSLCTAHVISSNSGRSDSCPVCFSSVAVNQKPIKVEIESFFKQGEGWRYDLGIQLSRRKGEEPEEWAVPGGDSAAIPAEQPWRFPLIHWSSHRFSQPGISNDCIQRTMRLLSP